MSLKKTPIYSGCTAARFERLGIHAKINARGGQQWRNGVTLQEVEAERDAIALRRYQTDRIRFTAFTSRSFRRRYMRGDFFVVNPFEI